MNFKAFEQFQSIYKEYLRYLDVGLIYPFILKTYTMSKDEKYLEAVFKALEIISFRHKLVRTRADLASRLNSVLKNFDSIENLIAGLQEVCSEEEWYWSDGAVNLALNNIYEENDTKIIAYLLMRYENYLREQNTQTQGYVFSLKEIKEPQIEHIAQQTENNKN